MKAVVQRSGPARCEINGKTTGAIPRGLVLLVSVDPAESSDGPKLRDLGGMTKRQVKEYIDLFGLRWDVQGAGRVVAQEPAPGTPLRDVTLCRLVFASEPMKDKPNETVRPASRDRL